MLSRKVGAGAKLRAALAAGKPVHGLWLTMESPSATEIAVAMGLSYVVVDCEHGHLTWEHTAAHIRAAVRSDTCVFVRVAPSANIDLHGCAAPTKRALDIGADGKGSLGAMVRGGVLRGDKNALLDDDGAAFVVHAGPDDLKTDPSGDSGGRIACGVFAAQ